MINPTRQKRQLLGILLIASCLAYLNGCCNSVRSGSAERYNGADKVLVPNKGWTCGMPEGIPVPEAGVPVFEVTMALDQFHELGKTPYGDRAVAVTKESAFSGGKLAGTMMTGGLDFQ